MTKNKTAKTVKAAAAKTVKTAKRVSPDAGRDAILALHRILDTQKKAPAVKPAADAAPVLTAATIKAMKPAKLTAAGRANALQAAAKLAAAMKAGEVAPSPLDKPAVKAAPAVKAPVVKPAKAPKLDAAAPAGPNTVPCGKCGRLNAKNPAARPDCMVASACARRVRAAKQADAPAAPAKPKLVKAAKPVAVEATL